MNRLRISPDVAESLLWFKELRDTSNPSFLPLYTKEHRYLVLKGGAGSGKSELAGHKVSDRCVRESGHRFLVTRKVKNTIRRSCYEQLVAQAKRYYPDTPIKENSSYLSIKYPSGSEVICAGLDDVEKLKSIYEITDVWIEEASEITEADFNQLDIRMRGKSPYYRQMILTFNPVSIGHWLKKRFFDTSDPRAFIHESTYKDNVFLTEEDRQTLERFKDIDEYYYAVYCLGQWGSVFRSIFPTKLLVERQRDLPRPVKEGHFEREIFRECSGDIIRIFEEPKKGRPYVIGADTAGEGSDRFAAHVIDNVTGRQVAVLHARIAETEFPEQIIRLGYMYNTALIAVECNFSTYTVHELERLGYPKQYVRQSIDSYTHKTEKKYGFVTSKITRPVIISNLVRIVQESPHLISDNTTIEEMLTFVRNEKLRAEAAEGTHDDLVMALAIAYQCREQQRSVDEEELVTWTRSMWEDYYSGNEVVKAEMIARYGRPKPRRER